MQAGNRGLLLALFSALGFSTLAIFGRYADIFGLSLVTLLFFRFLLATPLIWIPLAARGDLRPLGWRNLAIGAGLGAIGYALTSYLFLYGVNLTGAGVGAIVLYVYPAFVVIIAATVLGERVTRRTVAAVAMAIVGVALVTTGQSATVDPIGVAVVLVAAVVYANYISISRVVLETVDARTLTAHVIPAAAVTFGVIGMATGNVQIPTTVPQWGVILGISVLATVVPILTFFTAIPLIGASRTSIVSTFEPVFTAVLGVALLGEPLTPTTIAGGAAVLGGVVLIQTD